MARLMKRLKIAQLLQQEAQALLKLGPWVLASIALAAVLWQVDLVAKPGLFQSPPAETPPSATTEPTTEPTTPVVTATLTITPTMTPPAAPTATTEPTVTMEPSATPTEVPPTPTLAPSPTSDAGEPEVQQDESGRYADEGDSFFFDLGVLADTVAFGASYVWLCCGVLLLVGVPVLFIALWVVSNRRKQQGD